MNIPLVQRSVFLLMYLLARSMALDQAGSQATFPSSKPIVPTSSTDRGFDVDYEDYSDPESGSSATEAAMAAQGINTTIATIVPGTVPTSELTTVPISSTVVPTATDKTASQKATAAKLFSENSSVPSSAVPSTTVPSTTDPSITVPSTTVPSATDKTKTQKSAAAKLFAENSAVPSSTVPTKAVPRRTPRRTFPIETKAQQSEESKILKLLAENTATLSLSKLLLTDILATSRNLTWNLEKQKQSLFLIRHAEGLLLKATRTLFYGDAELHRGIAKAIGKMDGHANHIIDDLAYMLQLQNETKERIDRFSVKIEDIQRRILRSSKGFDQKLQRLRHMIQQNIKFKVLNLNLTASSLNISQVKSLAELRNFLIVWKNIKRRDMQITSLEHQLSMLNKTQTRSLANLTEDVQKWTPTNLDSINDQLQSLIISQKRMELELAVCNGDSSEKYHDPSADEEVCDIQQYNL